jgi:hypothetical protein
MGTIEAFLSAVELHVILKNKTCRSLYTTMGTIEAFLSTVELHVILQNKTQIIIYHNGNN